LETPGNILGALTTNFDDVLVDAFFYFRQTRPLVIHHDSLAPFIRPTQMRPMIVKLHGDHQLAPRNTAFETSELNATVQDRVSSVLHDRGLVFIGYGGADESIIAMLESLPEESLPFGVYWVSGTEPRGIFRQWLEARDAVWVEHRDFDELMLLLMQAFKFADPNGEQFQKVLARYNETKTKLLDNVDEKPRKPERPG
jgi:hypothetical protein